MACAICDCNCGGWACECSMYACSGRVYGCALACMGAPKFCCFWFCACMLVSKGQNLTDGGVKQTVGRPRRLVGLCALLSAPQGGNHVFHGTQQHKASSLKRESATNQLLTGEWVRELLPLISAALVWPSERKFSNNNTVGVSQFSSQYLRHFKPTLCSPRTAPLTSTDCKPDVRSYPAN